MSMSISTTRWINLEVILEPKGDRLTDDHSYHDNTAGKGEVGLCKDQQPGWQDTVIDGMASCEPYPGQTYAQRNNPHIVGESEQPDFTPWYGIRGQLAVARSRARAHGASYLEPRSERGSVNVRERVSGNTAHSARADVQNVQACGWVIDQTHDDQGEY